MKMVMVSCNEAIDVEVMELLDACGLKNYTKVNAAYGRGETSGTHLGNDIWPGRNNILFVACKDDEAKRLISCVKTLRTKLGQEGIKAFSWNLEEIT
jgi:hypothetical protein